MVAQVIPAIGFAALRGGARIAAGAVRSGLTSKSGGIDFNMSSNYKQLERRLNNVQRKQLPFAFSKTLNEVAKRIRKRIVKRTYPSSFDVRDTRFAMRHSGLITPASESWRRVSMIALGAPI